MRSAYSASSQGQQQGYHGHTSYSPQASQRVQTGYSPQRSQSLSGYTPTTFDGPGLQGVSSEQFYGSLLDMNGKPTQVFSRLADSLFFYMDQNCEVPGLRGTGIIEPLKYVWMSMKMGASEQAATIMLANMQSFYETGGIPFQFARGSNGGQIPIVDARGWLHAAVFEAKAAPEEAFKHWSRAIILFSLCDPMTSLPFPTPLPRSAFPFMADYQLSAAYATWRTRAIMDAARARAQARAAAFTSRYHMSRSLFGGRPGAMSYGLGVAQGSAQGGEGGDHATWKDAATAVANLANTIIGVATGGGGGGFLF